MSFQGPRGQRGVRGKRGRGRPGRVPEAAPAVRAAAHLRRGRQGRNLNRMLMMSSRWFHGNCILYAVWKMSFRCSELHQEHRINSQNREGGLRDAAEGDTKRRERLLQQAGVSVARRRERRSSGSPTVGTGMA